MKEFTFILTYAGLSYYSERKVVVLAEDTVTAFLWH